MSNGHRAWTSSFYKIDEAEAWLQANDPDYYNHRKRDKECSYLTARQMNTRSRRLFPFSHEDLETVISPAS